MATSDTDMTLDLLDAHLHKLRLARNEEVKTSISLREQLSALEARVEALQIENDQIKAKQSQGVQVEVRVVNHVERSDLPIKVYASVGTQTEPDHATASVPQPLTPRTTLHDSLEQMPSLADVTHHHQPVFTDYRRIIRRFQNPEPEHTQSDAGAEGVENTGNGLVTGLSKSRFQRTPRHRGPLDYGDDVGEQVVLSMKGDTGKFQSHSRQLIDYSDLQADSPSSSAFEAALRVASQDPLRASDEAANGLEDGEIIEEDSM